MKTRTEHTTTTRTRCKACTRLVSADAAACKCGATEKEIITFVASPRRQCRNCGSFAKATATACATCGAVPEDLPKYATSDEPTIVCSRCHLPWPISTYSLARKPNGHEHIIKLCRTCKTDQMRQRRKTLRDDRDRERHGIPARWKQVPGGLPKMLQDKVWRLLIAAAAARSAGMWQGQKAIRAYRDLAIALDEWGAPPVDRAILAGDEAPLEKHAHRQVAPASDADFDPRRHSTPRHLRERLTSNS